MSSISLYFFIFGRNPELSLAELLSYCVGHSIEIKPVYEGKKYVILKIPGIINIQQISQDLAGTIKIGKIHVITELSENIQEVLRNNDFYLEDNKLLNYSVTTYDNELNPLQFTDSFKHLYKYFKQKAILKKPQPSSLWNALQKPNYIDIVVFKIDSKLYFGTTLGAYNIKQNKKRYEQRPHVDESIGSSVRFSKILVNLSQTMNGILLDPFCGIGTVLQEALLLGFSVIGTELENKRVKYSTENLRWFIREFSPKNTDFSIFRSDVRILDEKIPSNTIDVVITEPELGPLLKSIPNSQDANRIMRTLEDLYKATFSNIDRILKPNGTFIIVLPRIIMSNGKKLQPNLQLLLSNTQLKLIPEVKIENTSVKFPILYKEKWHLLGRLVYLFRKH